MTEQRRALSALEHDVLERLRAGPIHLKEVNAALHIAPTTFKSTVRDLRKLGFDIDSTPEPVGKGCNVYTLVDHAD